MRLNPFDTSNIRVGGGGGGGFPGGGGGFPGGGGGQLGCGAIVIALIGALVFGIDPAQMLGGMQGTQAGPGQEQVGQMTEQELCTQNQYATESCNTLQSLNQPWEPLFRQAGIAFEQPTLWFYSGGVRSGCGSASSAAG
ncbi:MAG TPA: neutral zinc metallopeptidase, partial [Croceibacterium sp.]